jgi:hypothetical protein
MHPARDGKRRHFDPRGFVGQRQAEGLERQGTNQHGVAVTVRNGATALIVSCASLTAGTRECGSLRAAPYPQRPR